MIENRRNDSKLARLFDILDDTSILIIKIQLCTDQTPGYYSMDMTYDYACSLTPGHFIPPGFHAVSSCHFNAFLRYSNLKPWPLGPRVPTSPMSPSLR